MKRMLVATVCGIFLCSLVFLALGCSLKHPGETAAEGHRRHKRMLRLNRQEMVQDIDHFLLLEQPSKLSERRIH
jgi:hypothetical protein